MGTASFALQRALVRLQAASKGGISGAQEPHHSVRKSHPRPQLQRIPALPVASNRGVLCLERQVFRRNEKLEWVKLPFTENWCGDCRRAKKFLQDRGIAFREVNIDETAEAAALVMRVNNGRRKVPTIEVDGRYFSCSPFDPNQIAEELKIPLNR